MKREAPRLKAPPTHGKVREIISKDIALMARSYKRPYPLVIKRVKGSMVEDLNGNIYIDLTSGFGMLPLGGLHQSVIEAIKDQSNKLLAYSLRAAYDESVVELIEEISRIAPIRGDLRAMIFSSLSEAVEAALRALSWRSGRRLFLSFHGAFHGSTLMASALSSDQPQRRKAIGFSNILYAPYPYCFRCFAGLRPNECGLRCLRYLGDLLSRVSAEEVAAALIEPIEVEGGVIVPPENYLQGLASTLKKRRIILLVNESMTAPGRSGRWFAIERWRVDADAICLGPSIASGLPLGILIAREDLLELEPGMHESIDDGCQLSISAALATLRSIKDEGLIERADRIGREILKRFRDLGEELEIIGDVRGSGLLLGIELIKEDELPDEELAESLAKECFRSGLIVRRRGSTLILTPALNIEEEVLEKGLEILEAKLREFSSLRSRASSS